MSLDVITTSSVCSPAKNPLLAATAGDLARETPSAPADPTALVLDAATPLGAAAKAILSRPLCSRYDDAVVVGPDQRRRVLPVRPVFEELALHFSYRARHDTVTELPNRVVLAEQIQALLSRQPFRTADSQPALLCIDLGGFKSVNAEHGHEVGDSILRQFADRLRNLSRPGDIVARLAGDEFALLLTTVLKPAEALAVANRIVLAGITPFFVGERVLHLGASVGVACLEVAAREQSSRPVDVLLQRADEAMYLAKQGGRARAQLYDVTAAAAARTHREGEGMARDLRAALINGELDLHYQPKVALPECRVFEVEALARWQHPLRGAISPAEFIPVAERNGLIGDVGRWALRESCRQIRAWSDELAAENPALRPPVVAVNVSAYQLADPEFVTDVAAALSEYGLDADRLGLEITESAAVDDLPATIERLRELKVLGVTLSLDDFGTGYSSLTLMRQLPIDCVKIDKSFIDHIDTSAGEAVLVRLVIEGAHSLGLTVCAEGIERRGQWEQLVAFGCDSIQGYLLGVPAPAELTDPRPHKLRPPDVVAGDNTNTRVPLLPGSGQLTSLATPEGILTYVSAECVEMCGYQPAEMVGHPAADFMRFEDQTLFDDGEWSSIASPRMNRDFRLRHRDGHDVWVEADVRIVFDPATRLPTHILSTMRDISARIGVQQSLADRDRQLHAAFSASPVGISLTTPEGKMLQANPALCTLLGRSENELLACSISDLVHPDEHADRKLFDQLIAGERTRYQVDKRFLRPDGTWVWTNLQVTRVDDNDGTCAYVLAHVQGSGAPENHAPENHAQ